MNVRLVVLGLSAPALVGLTVWWLLNAEPVVTMDSVPGLTTTVSEPISTAQFPSALAVAYTSALGPLPASLADVPLELRFQWDANGELLVADSIKSIFDYFLSAVGDEPLSVVVSRIRENIDRQLSGDAKRQAVEILESYIDLKQALAGLETGLQTTGLTNIERQRQQMLARNEVRKSYLSPEVYEAFYADEERHDGLMLERLKIQSAAGLTAEQKQRLLAAHEESLPADLKRERRQAQIQRHVRNTISELKEKGASAEVIYLARVDAVGFEAAERLTQLDNQRAQRRQKIDRYFYQRAAILNSTGLSNEDKQTQVTNLRESMFDGREQIRIAVLERRSVP